ncbi:MAG TPA: hypothetical protein VM925_37135 [Labilithrix sp.]|nr:hypothetical protein [Labilithrix sp.]
MTEGLLLSLGGAFFFGCVARAEGADDDGDGGSSSDTNDASASSETSTSTSTGSAESWASGGTKAMTDKASYPDPFATATVACLLLTSATEGPCTEAADQVREDISEGYAGLPMRLALRVVDTDCNPIANAKVKVWHTQLTGSYSGNTPNNDMCLKTQADSEKHYFRGVQTTDDDGRVYFDSCFPGWYRGRTPHVHYSVTIDGKTFTSQLVFDQTLVSEIFSTHTDYEQFGQPDTANATDNVVGNAKLATFIATTARMSDGAMLASKELVVFNA